MLEKVIDVIESHFIDPFDDELDKDSLYNLVSGMAVDDAIRDSLTSFFSNGKDLMDNFISRLIKNYGSCKAFSDTIKMFPLKNFEETSVKAKVTRNGKQCEIRIQRDILAKLV